MHTEDAAVDDLEDDEQRLVDLDSARAAGPILPPLDQDVAVVELAHAVGSDAVVAPLREELAQVLGDLRGALSAVVAARGEAGQHEVRVDELELRPEVS